MLKAEGKCPEVHHIYSLTLSRTDRTCGEHAHIFLEHFCVFFLVCLAVGPSLLSK